MSWGTAFYRQCWTWKPYQLSNPSGVADLRPRYHTTNVNHIQPRLELTSTFCAERDIEYRSQAGLFPDFSWPHRDCITDMNHIKVYNLMWGCLLSSSLGMITLGTLVAT
ncbi:hypothetical protein SLA2020_014580 [Shorea laevis]